MNYQATFAEICSSFSKQDNPGKVATYIPELAKIDPTKFGVHLITLNHQHYSWGDAQEKFSIQSIAKVLALVLAYQLEGEKLWTRVGVEPSGDPFNSLVQLEYEHGIPRNPLINAGALVICDILYGHLKEPKKELIDFVRHLGGNPDIHFNLKVAHSEAETGFRNRSLIHLMKSFENIHHDIEGVLDLYFHLCSIEMTCLELARTFLFLASNGVDPFTQEKILPLNKTKRINAIMQLCGFYDEAGEFAFRVGLPGKSGVGGGIVAIHPGQYAITTWSPPLNEKGNSHYGMKFLEAFTTATASSIF